jgi:hypothetical protein
LIVFRKVVPLNPARHAALRLREPAGYGFAATVDRSLLMQAEMVRAAASYPILFAEDPQGDGFQPLALLGLIAGENLFVGDDGAWQSAYIPAVIRAYPFALARAGAADDFALCIDAGSESISLSDGDPLFDAAGAPSPILESVRTSLARLRQMQGRTEDFCRALAERNLLSPLQIRARRQGQAIELAGLFAVNEERLEGLSDARLADLRRERWLGSIYAHIVSLQHLERFATLDRDSLPESRKARPAD